MSFALLSAPEASSTGLNAVKPNFYNASLQAKSITKILGQKSFSPAPLTHLIFSKSQHKYSI